MNQTWLSSVPCSGWLIVISSPLLLGLEHPYSSPIIYTGKIKVVSIVKKIGLFHKKFIANFKIVINISLATFTKKIGGVCKK